MTVAAGLFMDAYKTASKRIAEGLELLGMSPPVTTDPRSSNALYLFSIFSAIFPSGTCLLGLMHYLILENIYTNRLRVNPLLTPY